LSILHDCVSLMYGNVLWQPTDRVKNNSSDPARIESCNSQSECADNET